MIPRHAMPSAVAIRRGVLLLITVSMLTLFMMLGAAYLVVATRARESARALARRTLTADEARVDHAAMLDNVLLTVVRGPATGQAIVAISGSAPAFESLLADRYGTDSVAGTFSSPQIHAAAGAGNTGPIVTGVFTRTGGGGIAHPAHLNGRILTFTGPGRSPTSHRILQASQASSTAPYSLTLSNPPGPYQLTSGSFPASGATAVINGREFAGVSGNESWDGFDGENAFLARVKPSGVSGSAVERPSYVSTLTGSSDLADNDNDGVDDGVFLNFGLPSIPIASGTSVRLDASVLVVDLDSRFNVNAHGSLANMPVLSNSQPTLYAPTGLWPNDFADEPNRLAFVPLGSGVGPAEVNASHLFSATALTAMSPNDSPRSGEQPGAGVLCGMASGSQVGKRPVGSRFTSGQDTPRIASCEGRHGGRAAPQTGFWSSLIQPLRDSRVARASQVSLRGVADDDLQKTPAVNNGVPPLWWLSDQGGSFDWGTAFATLPTPRSVYNSPPDVHGRMKTMTRPVGRETTADTDDDGRTTYGIVPRVSYAKPEWSTDTNKDAETKNNPYQARLRSAGSRGGYVHAPSTDGTGDSPMPTNPFTLAELERLLRQYDIDANQLPPRLVAMLGTVGEQMRTRLTSESWDTTGIVDGRPEGAWGRIAAAISPSTVSGAAAALYGSSPMSGILGGEIARGERFNLNRPLTGEKPAAYSAANPYYVQRQAYFKDLYTLLVLLDGSPSSLTASNKSELAQWAANVVEFRDADSTMTPFEYDTDIFDGWDVDGDMTTTNDADRAVVFGAERPEAVITHTLAWESDAGGEMMIGIHRPWHAYAHASGTTKIAGEPIDPALDSADPSHTRPQNLLDLGRKSGAAVYPIWRLRIVADGQTRYVRFDEETANANEFVSSTVTGAAATPKVGTDSWLCVKSNTNSLYGGAADWLTLPAEARMQRFTIDTGGVFKAPGAMAASDPGVNWPRPWPQPRAGKVYLERLADPTSSPTSTTWTADPKTTTDLIRYVVVDQAPLQIVRRSPETGKTVGDYNASSVTLRRVPRLLLRRTKDETAFWKTDTIDPAPPATYDHLAPTAWFDGTRGEVLTVPLLEEGATTFDVAWMPWPNRPFFSSAELLLVPKYPAIGILENYRLPLAKKPDSGTGVTLANGDPQATDLPRTVASGTTWPILDAVAVPTLFAAVHDSWVDSAAGHLASKTGIHKATHPVNQLSSYREPGRVNLNTVTNEQVWDAVVSGPLPSGAVASGSSANFATSPSKSARDLLALGAATAGDPLRLDSNATFIVSGTTPALNVARNPLHRLYTAGRLANVATTRSNVFAIWVTLRQQVLGDPDSVRYHRAFYIVDRSIPVGFQPGQDLNARDTILLRRIVE